MNKDNIITPKKNNVYTPELVEEALAHLPFNYVLLAFEILKQWKDQGLIKKSFSKRYIIKVANAEQDAFNEDILNALVKVGLENLQVKKRFGRLTKKTSKAN